MMWLQPGTKIKGRVPDVSVVLNPGDIACSAEDTSCVVNITKDGVYSVTVTLTNDVGSTEAMMVFNCELTLCTQKTKAGYLHAKVVILM